MKKQALGTPWKPFKSWSMESIHLAHRVGIFDMTGKNKSLISKLSITHIDWYENLIWVTYDWYE